MLCCGYTLLYTMGMERRMTKKEEVVSCVQRLAAAAPEKREVGVTTQELAEQLQMQRSNLSTLLNELVADGKMEKLPGRPVHYRPLMAGYTEGRDFLLQDTGQLRGQFEAHDSDGKGSDSLPGSQPEYPDRRPFRFR